jgi:hypothetical protein
MAELCAIFPCRVLVFAYLTATGKRHSGDQLRSTLVIRAERIEQMIAGILNARRELAETVPALASEMQLNILASSIEDELSRLWLSPDLGHQAIRHDVGGEIVRLRTQMKHGTEAIGAEMALGPHRSGSHDGAVSVNTAGGPALVNLGVISGNAQQVIGTLNEAGHTELAAVLQQLATVIGEATALGHERRLEYLEQVKFIAERASAPPPERQASIVKSLFEGLRARLQDTANIAQVLTVAGPVLARHFGYN